MDEMFRDLFDKVKTTAAAASDIVGKSVGDAGKKAGEVVEVTKLRVKIFDLKNDIHVLWREIGQLVYESHAEPDSDPPKLDEKLAAVDEKMQQIRECKLRIQELKKAAESAAGDGNTAESENEVCPHCGEPLDR